MLRLLAGIVKGLIAGAGVGALAYVLGIHGGFMLFLVYGAVGAVVGVICGKPPWRHETLWTPTVKALFGFAVGAGLYYAWHRVAGDFELPMAAKLGAPAAPMANIPYLLGGAIGIVYGAFVEIDDGGKSGKPGKSAQPAPKPKS
jgi:hypothetical protein